MNQKAPRFSQASRISLFAFLAVLIVVGGILLLRARQQQLAYEEANAPVPYASVPTRGAVPVAAPYPTVPPPPAFAPGVTPGALTVTDESDTPTAAAHGEKGVQLASFDLSASPSESVRIYGIAFEFYSQSWEEILPSDTLSNLRVVDDQGNVLLAADGLTPDQEIPQNGGYGYQTTYAWLMGQGSLVIDPGASRHFRLLADTNPSSELDQLHILVSTAIPEAPTLFSGGFPAHFRAVGMSTGMSPIITGSLAGDVYFKPQGSSGAVTFTSDSSYHPDYLRYAQGAILTKLHIAASNDEDVDLSQVAFRISNLVEGQYANVRLVREWGAQFGDAIADPQVADTGKPNVVFKGSSIIRKGQTAAFDLVADLSVDTAGDTDDYGMPYQHEVIIYLMTNQTDGWIQASSLASEEPLPVSGGADTFLKFR